MEDLFKRVCPKCNNLDKLIYYKHKQSMYRAIKINSLCRSCSLIEYPHDLKHSEETKKKLSIFHTGKKHSNDTKIKMSLSGIGKIMSKETRKKISEYTKNQWKSGNLKRGKIITDETKYKLRLAAIKRIQKQGFFISYNPKACIFIDKLNKEKGWNLQHAKNGGEIELYGYFVDGYDKHKNIIFEYDEKHHNFLHRFKKDLYRQQNIINKINPIKFIRYDEKNDRLYDVITNQKI